MTRFRAEERRPAIHVSAATTTAGNTSLLPLQLMGVQMAVVPEPSTGALMSASLALMALVARRRRVGT